MYHSDELIPYSDREKMIVGAVLRKMRGQVLDIQLSGTDDWNESKSDNFSINANYRKPGWVYSCR